LVAMPWRRQTSATQTPGFSVSCTAHFCSPLKRPAVRPPVRFLRYQAILTPRNWRRPLIEPGHSDEAGFTGPFRRRICRGDRVRCATHAAKLVASSACPMPPKFIASICMLQEAQREIGPLSCTRCSNPTPLGERRRRPRRDGNEDQGNANVQNSGAWLV
jgi:hypothetical protein